ncbi:MAG: hypothetical protein ACFFDQ_11875 [Candidatus Thorarchaeota archaeon]
MSRFRYTVPMFLLLGIFAVVVAGIDLVSSVENLSSYIPTLSMGALMIGFAIILSIMARREKNDET